ncbi:hypothetical protein D3C72_994670 [compost metagenome]
MRMALRSRSGCKPARVTSMGLRSSAAWSPVCSARKAAPVRASGAGSSKPATPRLSATSVPAPPVDVSTATRRPPSLRSLASAAGMSSRSANVCARMTPTSSNNASYMASAPANAPVCDAAAWAPDADRPTLYATMGLPAAAALRAAARKVLGLRMLSTYSAMTRVAGSSASASTKSARSRSTSLLVEISLDKPMPRAAARDSSAPRMPPLCDTRPTAPLCR